jgi:hypothetical protein
MNCAAAVVLLPLAVAWAIGIVAAVHAGEPFSGPGRQMAGQVKALDITCYEAQGACESAIVVAEARHGDVTLVIRPGTQIRRGEQALALRELELGVPIKAFAFRMSGDQHPRVVLIEVTDEQRPMTSP